MKTSKCLILGFQTFCCVAFLLPGLFIPYTFGQENIPPQKQDKSEPASNKNFTIRIAVEEVRLDAVVLDRKGHPINDLTADDFEIYQDDVPQKVLSSVYLTNQTEPSAKPALPGKTARLVAPIPAPALERDQVRRVLIFIVDDISMGGSIEFLHYSKMALTRFVEKQMQPGDLVAILRTSYGNSALQMFLSDKQQLLARINSIRWGSNAGFEITDENRYNVFDSQLSALRYSIHALKDLPGRKALLMFSAQTTIPNPANVFSPFTPDFYYRYIKAYNRLADQALRAGVVVNLLDIRGLEAPFSTTYASLSDRYYDGANPLPAKTGGMWLQNSNFFVDGIGEAENMLKGYYLLSYTPPATTFKDNRKNIYHRTKIKVKRRGTTIYTRDGFYGLSEPDEESTLAQNPLREAIFSPFQHNDLSVNLASGYLDDSKAGYVLRSWLHLDTKNINILKKKDEGYFVSLQTLTITSNIDGYIQDSSLLQYDFRIKEENLSWIKEHGIRFSLLLPVKKPGSYYVRVAVKDQESGKVGSAYQYVDIPDLKKNRLALSDIFVINRSEDAAWILSGQTKDFSQIAISPVLQRDESRSPALRSYLPGDHFQYMSVLYNAKTKKEMTPDLESQFMLYKDGSELFKSEAQPLILDNSGNFARIPIAKRLLLGDALQEGDYVLQLLVNDKQRKGKDGVASKTMSFRITPQ
jgi:VWFA-related protein